MTRISMSNHASSCVWRTLSIARMLYEWLCFSVLYSSVFTQESHLHLHSLLVGLGVEEIIQEATV